MSIFIVLMSWRKWPKLCRYT